jgi:hypothetical protein
MQQFDAVSVEIGWWRSKMPGDPAFIAIWVVVGIVVGALASFIVKAGSLGRRR